MSPADEPTAAKLNWLRAGVLGANDGIVSVGGLVMGIAGATTDSGQILTAGIAGLVSGALSMAAGEYVSVSTQRDAEVSLIRKEEGDLQDTPEEELQELVGILRNVGMTPEIADQAAEQLTEWNALRVHARLHYGIDIDEVTNPWAAAGASFLSFTVGALLPILTMLLPSGIRVAATLVAVVVALVVTGFVSARLGHANPRRAVVRNVAGGVFALVVTFGIGALLGTAVS